MLDCPASTSVAVAVKLSVASSSIVWLPIPPSTGASFTSVRVIVITAVSFKLGVPLSVTVAVRVKLGVVSKFNRALFATVIWPVVVFTAKAVPVKR